MNNDIIQIDELIKTIQENEYIDCSKDDLYDGSIYESIMFYLNFCKNWFQGINLMKEWEESYGKQHLIEKWEKGE